MKNVIIRNKIFTLLFIIFSINVYANDLYNKLLSNKNEYFSIDIDINNDGVLDKIISGQPYENNEIYFFIKEKEDYNLFLKGWNFSEDGGNYIYQIEKTSGNMIKIVTLSQNGNYIEEYFLNYVGEDELYLDKVIYINDDYLDPDRKTSICIVKQNIKLVDIYDNNLKIKVPDLLSKEEKCKITYSLNNISLNEIKTRIQNNNRNNFSTVSRYEAILNEIPISIKTLTQYNDIAYYLQQANANEEAIFLLEKIIEKYPNRTVAYLNLADAYLGKNNKEKAKENYKKYIELMKQDNKEEKIPKRVLEF
ncbi:hypothetical protein AFAEC_1775 [Aliarcobacter faecis]|uniref:tetratricopeptide repeat protein n=1 Tax=Aliarcobacter faecis TaxID=1564138 RepID=UPI0004B98552|nr:tetratricopeptide repeat protein [Aliarcobacter faecis]QKF73927.1 hypothetical protein AFAEC_1775 [Aliarcobacter faecis]